MRQGEACRLLRDDTDLETRTLVLRDSKFGKSRLVFLHPTTVAALRCYERARDRAFPEPEAATFLVNSRGRPLHGHNLPHTFAPLAVTAGIRVRPGSVLRGCTTCAIRQTAGLCALRWRFGC